MIKDCSVVNWHEVVEYDESSPSCLRWKHDRLTGKYYKIKSVCAGDPAGSVDEYGYWTIWYNDNRYKIHRVVWFMHNNSIDNKMTVDHINGNPSDNRIDNLRLVSPKVNGRNQKCSVRNTSGVCGVRLSGDTWRAFWHDLDSKQRSKSFSHNKYGYDESFRLACEYRKQMMDLLNGLGAGYSVRHGK